MEYTNRIGPGFTALTVMPCAAANSLLHVRTKLSSAAFDAKGDFSVFDEYSYLNKGLPPYILVPGVFILAATEETAMIRALSWLGMWGRNACVIRNGPRTISAVKMAVTKFMRSRQTIDIEDCIDGFDSLRFEHVVVDKGGVVHDDVNFEIGCITPCEKVCRSFQSYGANIYGATAIDKISALVVVPDNLSWSVLTRPPDTSRL